MECVLERLRVRILFNFERIEAHAGHEEELVSQNISGRPDLSLETETFPELPRLGVGPSIAEDWKLKRNQRKL
jgi:hypothetical protein